MRTFNEAITVKKSTLEEVRAHVEDLTGRYSSLIEEVSANVNTMLLVRTLIEKMATRPEDGDPGVSMESVIDIAVSAFLNGIVTGIEMERDESTIS